MTMVSWTVAVALPSLLPTAISCISHCVAVVPTAAVLGCCSWRCRHHHGIVHGKHFTSFIVVAVVVHIICHHLRPSPPLASSIANCQCLLSSWLLVYCSSWLLGYCSCAISAPCCWCHSSFFLQNLLLQWGIVTRWVQLINHLVACRWSMG